MEKLEAIFGSERETKLAEGLLHILKGLREPIVAFDLTEKYPYTARVAGNFPGPSGVGYNDVFSILIINKYIRVVQSGTTGNKNFHPSWTIEMTEEAKEFFGKNYRKETVH